MSVLASGFSWMQLLPGVYNDSLLSSIGVNVDTATVLTSFLIVVPTVTILALLGRMSLNKAMARDGLARFEADAVLTPRTAAELFAEAIFSILDSVLSRKDARAFFSLIASLFVFIFVSNILGIFPGFLPPTDNANTNFGMAAIVFLVFNAVGLWRNWFGYFRHMMGPVLALSFLVFPIEVISLFVRPFSLWVRLTGNIFGDHMVFALMSEIVPWGVPAIFLGLAIFVSLVQAFVFSLLTTVYIGLSVPHEEH